MDPAGALLKVGYTLIFYEICPIFDRAAYISISYVDLFALAQVPKHFTALRKALEEYAHLGN